MGGDGGTSGTGAAGYERRIGRRIGIDPLEVVLVERRPRRFRGPTTHEVPGRIDNVSVTGAAVVGPDTLAWQPGDEVVLRSEGRDNVVVVRHRQPLPHGALFGVELTRAAAGLQGRIRTLLDPVLAPAVDEPPPSGPILGLHREAPARRGPPLPPGPVIDLSGPEPVIDLTDAVMGVDQAVPPTALPPEERPATAPPPPTGWPLPPSPGRQALDDVFGLMDDGGA